MQYESASAIVIRTAEWSETSRIATLFTMEFGKVRAVAKGGRRLKSNFDAALDLLTVCRVVLVRKREGLDVLTEARVEERFAGLAGNLQALYAGYYVAELLDSGSQDHDPHPRLYGQAVATLRRLLTLCTQPDSRMEIALQTFRFELAWLHELGYRPRLESCAACGTAPATPTGGMLGYSVQAGGVLCANCAAGDREKCWVNRAALDRLRSLVETPDAEPKSEPTALRDSPLLLAELRQLLGRLVSHALQRRPRLLAYLE